MRQSHWSVRNRVFYRRPGGTLRCGNALSSSVLVFPRTLRCRALTAVLALSLPAIVPLASPAAAPARTTARPASKTHTAKPRPRGAGGYHPRYTNAPADEYFGRLGMSILGVRNKVKDLGLDADLHPEHDRAILNGAVWVEDAMRDWARKYPFDRWLPRYAFALEQMYEEIPGDEAHKRAIKQLGYITAYFPQTVYARVGRAMLAMGVPAAPRAQGSVAAEPIPNELQRLALIDGKVVPTIPPAPTPSPAPTEPPVLSSPAPAATTVP